jgi:hypothetical protein
MSFAELLAAVARLSDAECTELARRLRARELANDPARTADMSRRLDRTLAGEGVVTEEEFRARTKGRSLA